MAELLKSLQGLVGAEVSVKIAEVLDSVLLTLCVARPATTWHGQYIH